MTPTAPEHPGLLLKRLLVHHGWSHADFQKRSGVWKSEVSRIIRAEGRITLPLALKFERASGIEAETWLMMQMQWDLYTARKENTP